MSRSRLPKFPEGYKDNMLVTEPYLWTAREGSVTTDRWEPYQQCVPPSLSSRGLVGRIDRLERAARRCRARDATT